MIIIIKKKDLTSVCGCPIFLSRVPPKNSLLFRSPIFWEEIAFHILPLSTDS